MKILHVVEALATGILYSISRICRHLEGEFEFHLLHGQREETPIGFREYFPPSTQFHPWAVSREIHPLRDGIALRELYRVVEELQPDIIHAHSSKAGALTRIAYRASGPPVLYSPRGYSFLRLDVSGVHRFIYRSLERFLAGPNTVTVACGLGEFEASARNGIKTVLVPNLLEELAPAVRACQAGPLKVVMLGGIRPQKNFPLFAQIARDSRLSEFQFVWIGGGPTPSFVSVPENLTVTGWVSRDEALAHLREADVFAQTSLWEGLPIGVLEGMMMGLPLLAFPAVGNSDLVIDGYNGFLCRKAGEFADRLISLGSNPDLRLALGSHSRDYVRSEYTPDRAIHRWRSMYNYPQRYIGT